MQAAFQQQEVALLRSGPRLPVRIAYVAPPAQHLWVFAVFLLTVFMWGRELSPWVDGKLEREGKT